MTTKDTIRTWLRAGINNNKLYMFVIHDSFDHSDYPVYFDTIKQARLRLSCNDNNADNIIEIYDINYNIDEQLAMHRCRALTSKNIEALENIRNAIMEACYPDVRSDFTDAAWDRMAIAALRAIEASSLR